QDLRCHRAIVAQDAEPLDRSADEFLCKPRICFKQLHGRKIASLKFDHLLVDKRYQLPVTSRLRHEVGWDRKHCRVHRSRLQRVKARDARAYRQNHNVPAAFKSLLLQNIAKQRVGAAADTRDTNFLSFEISDRANLRSRIVPIHWQAVSTEQKSYR